MGSFSDFIELRDDIENIANLKDTRFWRDIKIDVIKYKITKMYELSTIWLAEYKNLSFDSNKRVKDSIDNIPNYKSIDSLIIVANDIIIYTNYCLQEKNIDSIKVEENEMKLFANVKI